jgi:iron complex outermembrane receptor protein/outer membrane receptor for ferrienterochelin and colicins
VSLPLSDTLSQIIVYMKPEAELMDVITVSATRNNSRIEDSPTKIEVIGIDDMQEENSIRPGNIVSIIGDMAGIQMQQTSTASGNLNARIQGLNGRYSQILKDGMPLYGGFSGSFGILQVPPIDLRQIEIIKGSASTLFGGDAIGGIINLVSKEPTPKPETNLMINQTTLKETDANIFLSRKYDNLGFLLFAGTVYQRPTDVNKDGFSDLPDLRNFNFHPKIFYYFNKNTTLSIGFNGIYETRKGGDMQVINQSPSGIHQYFVSHISNRNTADFTFVSKSEAGSAFSIKASSSLLYRSIETKGYFFSANQNLYYSELSYLFKNENYDFVFGMNLNGDIFNKKDANNVNIPNYKYSTLGFFIQNDLRLTEKLLIESGFRYDKHSQYGNYFLPQLSILYKFAPNFSARLNGGLGYKIPVIFDYIYEETDLERIQTNQASLSAETSKGLNFDINYNTILWDKFNITLNQSFYYTLLNHPIVYAVDSIEKVILSNAGLPVETQGFQTYLRLSYSEFELYLSYAFTDAKKKYDPENPYFLATPKSNLAMTAMYEPTKNWRFGIESSIFSKQQIENNEETPSYIFMALMIQRNIGNLTVVLNCENLLDYRQKDYLIGPISNPTFRTLWAPIDGRAVNLSLNYKL